MTEPTDPTAPTPEFVKNMALGLDELNDWLDSLGRSHGARLELSGGKDRPYHLEVRLPANPPLTEERTFAGTDEDLQHLLADAKTSLEGRAK